MAIRILLTLVLQVALVHVHGDSATKECKDGTHGTVVSNLSNGEGSPGDVRIESGYFWHVTDMHWDPTYTTWGGSCGVKGPANRGTYGEYACDSSWALIQSAVGAMKKLHPDPDFLIWTGDDTPHIWNDSILDQEAVYTIIHNLTTVLEETFPTTTVFSALGNHDWSPKSQLPGGPNQFYDRIADRWQHWLSSSDANTTFRKGGYYQAPSPIHSSLWVAVLNTNLYYESDKLTAGVADPAEQLKWLEELLDTALKEQAKVMVIGHVPPGLFEKHRNKHWFYPEHNEAFIVILRKHSGVIGSIHFAHHHTDSFRILKDDKGSPLLSMLLAPAVTPWETTLPGVIGGTGNNPSIRLVEYDRHTGAALNVQQYYLNLTQANTASAEWKLAYDFKSFYNLQNDLDGSSLNFLAERFKSDKSMFDKYYSMNGVLYDPTESCTGECMYVQYCAVTQLHYDKYDKCVKDLLMGGATSVTYSLLLQLLMAVFIYNL